MNTQDMDAVQAFIDAINDQDLTAISRLMKEDHTFIDLGGQIVSGREKMVEGWQGFFRMFPDYKNRVEMMLADKGVVAVFGWACGTYNGKRGLLPENRIEMPAAWKAVVEDGKIKSWQVYADWTEGSKIIEEDNRC
ncbi:MAG: nuclear transport factor 2 family protein [Anaerolineales bacterium]|nr:nuclear transport factor 2 family protein [Anaerolineales bacterium]